MIIRRHPCLKLTHFSWIPKHLSGLLRQLKRAQTTRPQTCQKNQTYTRINFKIIPSSPQTPALHPLRTPLLCLGKKCVMKKAKRRKGTTGKRSSDWRGSEETCRGKSNNRDAEGRRLMSPFFYFSNTRIKPKMKPNQTKTNGLKLNFTQWNETKY